MDSKVSKAIETFRNPYSCAQAVYAAFADVDEEKLAFLKENSGGHAPDGKCGALFAAEQLCGTDIDAEFEKKAGALQCLVLKRECKTSCQDCVKIAAEIVAKNKS